MIIKKAEKKDLPAILSLQKLCYYEPAQRYNNLSIPPLTQTIEELEHEFSCNTILKAVIDSEIIGSIRAYAKDAVCYIGRVIVHPEHQNKGIGKSIMLEIEKSFSEVSKYELFTGFKDEKNLYFYQKLGYTIFKEEVDSNGMKFIFLEKINKNS